MNALRGLSALLFAILPLIAAAAEPEPTVVALASLRQHAETLYQGGRHSEAALALGQLVRALPADAAAWLRWVPGSLPCCAG